MFLRTGCYLLSSAWIIVTAQEVSLDVQHAAVITFLSESNKTYKVLAAPEAAPTWTTIKDGILGTDGEVTIFYKADTDQKLFFKVEITAGGGGVPESLLEHARLDLTEQVLSGYQLEDADLRRFTLTAANLSQANLAGASLNFARLDGAILDGANLVGANLSDASVRSVSFRGADLRQTIWQKRAFEYYPNLSSNDFRNANLSGVDLAKANLNYADFQGANLNGFNLSGATAAGANFQGQDMRQVVLDGRTIFEGAKFNGATFEGKTFHFANGVYVNLRSCDFSSANVKGATFSWADLSHTAWNGAFLDGAIFSDCSLPSARFPGQDLSGTIFRRSVLTIADLTGANLSGAEISRSLVGTWYRQGAVLTNINFEGTRFLGFDGSAQDFRGGLFRGGLFSVSTFVGADLSGVDMSLATVAINSTFDNVNLSGGNLEGSLLKNGKFTGANLRDANLRDADLRGANLQDADLTGSDLSFAQVGGAKLSGVIGFNADAPGLDFGASTMLPNGSNRNGKNPGVGFAPATVPGQIQFNINDLGVIQTRVLSFDGGVYSEAGQTGGAFLYRPTGGLAELVLPGALNQFTLRFTSPTAGTLFRNVRDESSGLYVVGTFTIPQ